MTSVTVDTIRQLPGKEPRPWLSGMLALLVHIIFIGVLIFGFNWKDQPSEGMVVDLWQDFSKPDTHPVVKHSPPPTQPEAEPEPAPQPVSEPETKSEPTKPVTIKAVPPPPKKPDFKVKDNQPELDPTVQNNTAQEKIAQEKAQAERLQRAQEAEKQRKLEAQQKREQAEKARLEAQQAAARAQTASEIDKYKAMILAKIRSRIVIPPDLPGNPVAEFNVTLLPGGDVLHVQLRNSSGYTTFDNAVERAILLSKPLPLPPNPSLFNEFRNLHITVHYLE